MAIWRAHWQRYRGSQAPLVRPTPSQKPTPETRNHTCNWRKQPHLTSSIANSMWQFELTQLSLTVCRVMKAQCPNSSRLRNDPAPIVKPFFVAVSHPAASISCFKPVFLLRQYVWWSGLILSDIAKSFFSDYTKTVFLSTSCFKLVCSGSTSGLILCEPAKSALLVVNCVTILYQKIMRLRMLLV